MLGSKGKAALDDMESLIEAQLDGLYRAALRYTRNASAAEDLVHDTVVRALRFRDRFEPGTNFRAWIFTILTHTFIHKYRRSKRERELLSGATRQDVEAQLASQTTRDAALRPEHSYMDQLLSDEVVAALDDLPEEFRTVIVLCDIEGLSYKEIAEALACPVGTVMSRLYRGRRQLEASLYRLAQDRGIIKTPAAAGSERQDILDLQAFRRRRDA
ncbi:MAG: sigma-70 family RNA polymerase sigma factor [Deltaproteobacteria bacterium]|nr:sigma-70 family RNA polymerase sigma factor [Deltaproteobacteria bacterium]